ncbi:protoheme IX farnesyltransferase [Pisolithus orientalis]|uniref:protoheme IX farnesyltransferase n=1 Tax=Pisolithus orientalis TaxID=936130 RepID=UPI002224994B|nr:protoheme IX farnesyltransferase [Pisolithus orientalis]KAI6025788.1 protoheme IX farnesyltransferase [Pisolithus orientalis]
MLILGISSARTPCSRFLAYRASRPFARVQYHSACSLKGFSSFFFHNGLWKSEAAVGGSHGQCAVRHSTHTCPVRFADFRETSLDTPRQLLNVYGQLSKLRLTILVMLSATSGVAMSPLPTTLPILLSTALGTALCSASANTFNQIQEVPYDAQMARTRQRPLVRRAISPLHATVFGVVTGIAGPALLWTMTNPVTVVLGATNIGLYAGLYTWLKRKSVFNTWVGAVVGGIPPLMGWTACGGKLLPTADHPVHFFLPSFLSDAPLDPSMADNPLGAVVLFILLYSWQFPHFNSLSHLTRASYAQAGYKMLSVLSPRKNAVVSLRHTLLLLPLCSLVFPLSGLTTWGFALTSFVPNLVWIRAALAFWRTCGEKQARKTFQHSLWYLPMILALMMLHKQGMDWTEWIRGDTTILQVERQKSQSEAN